MQSNASNNVSILPKALDATAVSTSVLLLCHQPKQEDDEVTAFSRMKKTDFSSLLIEEVRKRPNIYDSTYGAYRDPARRENSWREIAAVCKRPAKQCHVRWRSLRDRYVKERKQELQSGIADPMFQWIHYEQMKFLNNSIGRRRGRQFEDVNDESEGSSLEKIANSNDDSASDLLECILSNGIKDQTVDESSLSILPLTTNEAQEANSDVNVGNKARTTRKYRKRQKVDTEVNIPLPDIVSNSPVQCQIHKDEDTLFLLSLVQRLRRLPAITNLKVKMSIMQVIMNAEEGTLGT